MKILSILFCFLTFNLQAKVPVPNASTAVVLVTVTKRLLVLPGFITLIFVPMSS